mgnify:CR=1 FL=1
MVKGHFVFIQWNPLRWASIGESLRPAARTRFARTHPKSTLSPPWRLGRALREKCFLCRTCRRILRYYNLFRRLRTSIQGVALKTHNLFEKRLIKNFHSWFVRTVWAEFSIGVCATLSAIPFFVKGFGGGAGGTFCQKGPPCNQFII